MKRKKKTWQKVVWKMAKKERTSAIVLAAGSGKRMESSTKKQYMLLREKPVIYYSLKAFQESFIDEIVLVVSPGDIEFCQKEIVGRYGFSKVRHIIEGGKERYHSVAAGLNSISECDFVFIHDGARPLVTEEILNRALSCVKEFKGCVVGMPVKDTIKIADKEGYISSTPDRKLVWMVQTPQVFEYTLIKKAYDKLIMKEKDLMKEGTTITDDAMVVEKFMGHPVKLAFGSYENINITTPEDIITAENFIKDRESKTADK